MPPTARYGPLLVVLVVLSGVLPLPGAYGLRTVGNDEFQKVTWVGAPISYTGVSAKCNTLNSATKGWYPAAARGSASLTAILQEAASTDFCFIGGVPFDVSGNHADYSWFKPTASSTRHVLPDDSMWCTSDSAGWVPAYIEPYYTKINYVGQLNYIAASGTGLSSQKVSAPCVICAAYRCSIADGDASAVQYAGGVCNGVGTISGWLPSCGCICDKKFYGPRCQYPVTPTPTLTISLPKTASQSAPHTSSRPHTHSATPSTTAAVTSTLTLPLTPSPGPTPTLSHIHTFSEPLSATLSLFRSSTVSQSVSMGTRSLTSVMTLSVTGPTPTSSQPTPSSTVTSSPTFTSSATMSISSSVSTTDSVSSSGTATSSIAVSDTYSLSPSGTLSISAMTVSESTSETSKCGMINTMMIHQPFMCIQHPSGSEHVYTPCSEMATSPPGPTDDSTQTDTSTWNMGSNTPAAYTWDSSVWQGGETLSFSFQIDQPLSLSTNLTDFGNTTRDSDVPELVDVTQWMGSTSRSAPIQLLVSTTIRFYIYDSFSTSRSSFSNGPAPPQISTNTTTGVSQRVVAKRRLMAHLASYPRQRIGVLLRFGGAFEEDHANLAAALFGFQIPINAIDCGKELIINHERLLLATASINVTAATNISFHTGATLTARLKLMPPESTHADLSATLEAISKALTPVSNALSLAGMMPSAILAMGVQNSISGIADCKGFWIPITLDYISSLYQVADLEAMAYEEFDILSSPIGLSANILGSAGTSWVGPEPRAKAAHDVRSEAVSTVPILGRYMRGAMIAAIILITAFSMGVLTILIVVWRARRAFGVDMKTARDEEEALQRLEAIEQAIDSNNGSIPPPPPAQKLSWWASEQHDLNDAAALLQVPSISLLALAILGDGISLGGTMLLTLRISFMLDDQYAAVYRSLALQHGFIPDLIFGEEDGRLEAPGMAPVVLDMILSILLLSLMFGYIVHLFYITYTAPLGLVSITDAEATTDRATSTQPPTTPSPHPIQEDPDDATAGVDQERVPLSNNHSMCSDVTSTGQASPLPLPRPSKYAAFKRVLVYLFESVAELRPIRSTPPTSKDNIEPPKVNPATCDADAAVEKDAVGIEEPGVEMVDIDEEVDLQSVASEYEEVVDPLLEKGEQWMRRYGLYVGGTTWALYLPIDFTVAFVIGCLEGIATGSLNHCAIKAILSVLLLLIQLAVLLYKRPLSARFDQASTVLSMVLTIVSGTLVVVDLLTKRQNPLVGVAAEAIMMSAAFTVSAQAMIGAINSVLHIHVVIRQILFSIRNRINIYKKGNVRRGVGFEPPIPQFDDIVGGYDDPMGDGFIVNESMVSVVSQDLQQEEEEGDNEGVMWRGFILELEEEEELRLQPPPPPPRPPGPQQHYRRGGR